jgi:signal transduction histidine kinase
MTEHLREEESQLLRKIAEVEEKTRELAAAQASLVRSERLASVGRLAAGLAHEVGNPLSALIGLQELLLAGGLSEAERADFLERMKKETARIHRVLSDLLTFARPGADRARAGSAGPPGQLSDAVADVVALLTPQRDLKDVAISLEVAPELPRVPLCHEELVQVVLNLVMNAADALGRRGNIRIEASAPSPERVRLAVEDDGPGVAPEVACTLFEPFVSTKEVGKGTGLGLSVTRGLVEGAGGSITLEKAPGARFVIELPAVARTTSR